jgi:hypothetical protein
MLLSPSGGTPDVTSLGRWANEIAPAVREASENAHSRGSTGSDSSASTPNTSS